MPDAESGYNFFFFFRSGGVVYILLAWSPRPPRMRKGAQRTNKASERNVPPGTREIRACPPGNANLEVYLGTQ